MTGCVLITGATGFAGRFLVEHYSGSGSEVHGVYRREAVDHLQTPYSATLHRVDLLDADAVKKLVASVRPELVFHLAAQSSVAVSWRDPLATVQSNAAMQFNVLEAVAACSPAARVLVVGSSDEYGHARQDSNPIKESQELLPANPYALSKVVQDLMGYQYFLTHGLQVVRVRPFLQLGPRRPDHFAVGSFARQVAEIARGAPAVVRAGNIDLARDFTDVRDVVAAYAVAAEKGEPGEVYNIASGEGHTLRDLIQRMLAAAGVDAQIIIDERLVRHGEPRLLIGDASKLRRRTGWMPGISFEQSAADTVAYWQAQTPGGG